jgi:hypothetical protein
MSGNLATEITRKEHMALKELLRTLQSERDAIVSFSLEGIIEQNNRKEQILGELEYLKGQKEKFLERMPEKDRELAINECKSITAEIEEAALEVKTALQKNMNLLSFSVDHVRSSIEHIMSSIADSTYGRKQEQKPLLFSKVI